MKQAKAVAIWTGLGLVAIVWGLALAVTIFFGVAWMLS